MFENYKNEKNNVTIFQIYENKIFLYILCEYMPYGNLYNFIYNEFDKNTLEEDEVFVMF